MAKAYSITSKYQVTLPEEVREALAVGRNSKVEFIVDANGDVTIRKVPSLDEVSAMLHEKYIARRMKPATDADYADARDKFYRDGGKW